MEAIIFFSGIAFVAGMITRSLFVTQRQPQVIYVQMEPMEQREGSGCLPLLLFGVVILVLLAAGHV